MKTNKSLNPALILAVTFALTACQKETSINSSKFNASEVNEAKLATQLMAWYTFDGDDKDHSGNGNDVIYNNATPASGKSGIPNTAYKFDGSSNFMRVANSLSLQLPLRKGITLAAQVKVDGFYQGICHGNRIFQKGEDKMDGVYYLSFDDKEYWKDSSNFCNQPVKDEYQQFYGTAGNTQFHNATARGGEDIIPGKWYTVIFTFDYQSRLTKLFINNKTPVEVNVGQQMRYIPNQSDLYIGRMENNAYPYWFNGVIDEIRIYNGVLSNQEADFVYRSMNE